MGNTENFELCAISSEIQSADCALCREYCTCGKRMQPAGKASTVEQSKIRRPVNPPGSLSKTILPTEPDMDHLCGSTCITKAREMLKKARKHKNGGYKSILDRWNNDGKYRKSLSDIVWTEEQTHPI